MAIPSAPPDKSGGFMTVQYTNGTDTHRQRLHLLPFSTTQFVPGAGATAPGADSGNHDYAYTPFRSGGPESGIVDTFAAYAAKWAPLYSTAWSLTLLNLYQNVGNVLTEVPLLPITSAQPGTSAGATQVGLRRAAEVVFNIKTVGGARARLVYIAQCIDQPEENIPYTLTPTAGGTVPYQGIMGYISGTATGIVGRDGTPLAATAHVTGSINRRLRRHYGYA